MFARLISWELGRTIRRKQQMLIAVALPVAIYLINESVNRGETVDGLPEPIYIMASMAGFGALMVITSVGAQISEERAAGWNRQLRLTGLPAGAYVAAKGLIALATATVALVAVYLTAGFTQTVSLTAGEWAQVAGLQLVALLPFAFLSVGLGYITTPDQAGTLTTGLTLGLIIVGGLIWPIEVLPDFVAAVGRILPSYWLGHLGRVPFAPDTGSLAVGVANLAAWTLVFGVFAAWRYRSDARA
jgi:ABC-2 type transport system permease protein